MLTKVLSKIVDAIRRSRRREITYRELMQLDDRQLADIGLARGLITEIALTGASRVTQVGAADISTANNVNRPNKVA